eukprot:7464464-Pyramimonas_sp.AAC.1
MGDSSRGSAGESADPVGPPPKRSSEGTGFAGVSTSASRPRSKRRTSSGEGASPGCRRRGKATRSEELLVDGPLAGPPKETPVGQPARRLRSRGPAVAVDAADFACSSAPGPTQPVLARGATPG